jgi:hypothetical protein
MKIIRNLPKKYVLGEGEVIESEINSLSDLLNLQWIKEILSLPGEVKYHLSSSSMNHDPDYLMALIKLNGEVKYNVIGYIYGDGTKLGLKYYN